MTPVLGASDKPAGSVPVAIDQVYGVVPPVAASVAVYAVFCVALGSEVVVMVGWLAAPVAENVAITALQFAAALSVKVPVYAPVALTKPVSVLAREVLVFCWPSV